MANQYYGITVPGGNALTGAVTKATSTTSKNVELVVLDGVSGMTKEELLASLDAIIAYVQTDNAPA